MVGLRIESIKEQYQVLKLAIDLYEHCYWEVSLYELIKLLSPKFGWKEDFDLPTRRVMWN